jgi:hypothetical protein
MEINIVDTADRDLLPIWRQLTTLKQDPMEIASGPNGVDRMITEIIKKVKTPRSIDVLRILSHGNSGVIAITGGDRLEYDSSAISIWNMPKLEPTLRRLTPYFKPNARVELLACYVATHFDDKKNAFSIRENSDGEKLILELARIWQVKILASGRTEKGLPIASVKFVGLVVEANPRGGLSCVAAPEVSAVR